MKLKTHTLVLLVVALVSGAGIWTWVQLDPGSGAADNLAGMGELIFNFSEDDIEQMAIQTSEFSIQFERTANTFPQVWTILTPVQAPADEAAIAFLLSQLTTGRRDRTLEVPASQLADFGLAPPTATVDVTLKTEARHRLLVGAADFSQSFVYVRIDPEDDAADPVTIHLAPVGLLDAVDRSLAEWQQAVDATDGPANSPEGGAIPEPAPPTPPTNH